MFVDQQLIVHGGSWDGHALCEIPYEYLTLVAFRISLDPASLALVDAELSIRANYEMWSEV